jgi:hypothetical protein
MDIAYVFRSNCGAEDAPTAGMRSSEGQRVNYQVLRSGHVFT